MTILLDPLAVDASRSTPRDEEAPVPQLWASSARIVEVEFRMHCNCFACNHHKGPSLGGVDPLTQSIVLLFHPRNDRWTDHFRWNGPLVYGLTPCGRATIALLDLNDRERVRLRQTLIAEGAF